MPTRTFSDALYNDLCRLEAPYGLSSNEVYHEYRAAFPTPIVPPIQPPQPGGPHFPVSVPGYSRIITRTFDMATSGFGQDFANLTQGDLIIIGSLVSGREGAQGNISLTAFGGSGGVVAEPQVRKLSISKVAGDFAVPYPYIVTAPDPAKDFRIGPALDYMPGLEVGLWYYWNVASTTGENNCDMRIGINRPR